MVRSSISVKQLLRLIVCEDILYSYAKAISYESQENYKTKSKVGVRPLWINK